MWIWYSPGGTIIYTQMYVDSDHNLVTMKVRLTLKRLKQPARQLKWNLEALKGIGKEKLNKGVTTRLLESDDSVEADTNAKWSTLKRAVIESAEQNIGRERRRAAKKPWVTETMLRKMDERRKWKRVNNKEGKRKYRELNNELRRETEKAREDYWVKQCLEIEDLEKAGKMDKMYRKVKELNRKRKSQQKTESIMSKQGELMTVPEQVNERWKEYIEELYNKEGKPKEVEIEEESEVERDQRGPNILESKILRAIHDLKSKKAEGADGIPAELLKTLSEEGEKRLVELCQAIYNTGLWPKDFLISIIVPIQKKPNAQKCEDHRTISLIAHASKILLKVLNNRVQARTSNYISWDQFGFRKGVGTREGIATVRTLAERCIEHDQSVYICFVDYEKAFDRVDWWKLMAILKDLGVDWRDRRLITALYMGQEATVRTEHGMAGPCTIRRGVRQGCLLSPLLFNIYAEAMMKEAMEEVEEGVRIGGHRIQAVRFADDQAMTASTADGLQNIMTKLNEVVERYKMRINKNKTKVMKIGKGEQEQLQIEIGGNILEQIHQFKYLGSMITEDGRSEKEVRRRVALAKDAFMEHRMLLTKSLNQTLKKRLAKSLVWSVLLYGSEAWTLKKDDIRRLEFWDVGVEKNGEDQLDRESEKWRSAEKSGRRTDID